MVKEGRQKTKSKFMYFKDFTELCYTRYGVNEYYQSLADTAR